MLESKTVSLLSWNLYSSGDALPRNQIKTVDERVFQAVVSAVKREERG